MLLVIGYGNELRCDDGVGPRVARAVAAWGWPGVEAVARHQLTPDLAEVAAGADEVFFVDAVAEEGEGVRVLPLESHAREPGIGHVSSPHEVLALAEGLFGRRPRAWLVAVPGEAFGFGEELSPRARLGMGEALRLLDRCLKPSNSRARTPADLPTKG